MATDGLTDRLLRRIRRDFPDDYDDVVSLVSSAESGNQDRERVLAAVVMAAAGNLHRLHSAVELSQRDWRDALVAGGLANGDWPDRLDRELGGHE